LWLGIGALPEREIMPDLPKVTEKIRREALFSGTFSREMLRGLAIFSWRLMERVCGLGLRTVLFLSCGQRASAVRMAGNRGELA
jgi:hypothetical protein